VIRLTARRWTLLALLALAACAKPAPRTTVQQFMEGTINPAGDFQGNTAEGTSDRRRLAGGV
jgi:hypothetical protein